jgi:hypothetical protein
MSAIRTDPYCRTGGSSVFRRILRRMLLLWLQLCMDESLLAYLAAGRCNFSRHAL